jgi:hypothetical protein
LLSSVTGTKFRVLHDDPTDLKAGRLTELPAHKELYKSMPEVFAKRLLSVLGYWSAMAEFDFAEKPEGGLMLNELLPGMKPRTVKDVLELRFGASC